MTNARFPCTGGYGCGETAIYWRCRHHSIGCHCQYGPGTPTWYASVRDCPIHGWQYDEAATPQWWRDGEARGWRTEVAS